MNTGNLSENIEGNSYTRGWTSFYINISLLVFIADQLSKLFILKYLKETKIIIPNFFNLVLVWNKGAAWGILSKYPRLLTAIAFVALFTLIVFFEKMSDGKTTPKVAFSLLIGGIIGNLFDRIIRGAVVDFLDFYIKIQDKEHHWPAFNIADSAITISVLILLLSSFIKEGKKHDERKE